MAELKILDLVSALIDGAFDTPPWGAFLSHLREATGADHAVLIVHPPGRPLDGGLQLVAGGPRGEEVVEFYKRCFLQQETLRRQWIEAEKIYSLGDLLHLSPACEQGFPCQPTEALGIVDARYICLSEQRGVEAWLVVSRGAGAFQNKDETVLAALTSPLRATLRVHVAAASDRFRAKMAAEAVRRLRCGWFYLDAEGYVLSADPFGDAILTGSKVLSRNAGGRLTVCPAELEREVLQAVAQLANGRAARPRAIPLRGDPWLDMLLVPARKKILSDGEVPSVIAYVHSDNWRSADRCGQLCDLFDLSPSEARLALVLCRGKSIAEAGSELGLKLETARSYSKSIYSKTGTRGMADLVRVVMGSVLALAPDD